MGYEYLKAGEEVFVGDERLDKTTGKYLSLISASGVVSKEDELTKRFRRKCKYRYLEVGEKIEESDQIFTTDNAKFTPMAEGYMWLVGMKFGRAINQVRRKTT